VQEIEINKKFNTIRVWIPLLLGLFVSAWLLYTNLTKVTFEQVPYGSGDYTWVDYNANGTVELSIAEEFVLEKRGNYIKHNYATSLSRVNWTSSTLFWIVLACLMMVIRDLGYIMRIRLLTNKFLSWRQSFRTIMLWEFASTLTPGVVGGAAVAMFILKKENIPLGKSTAIIITTTILDNLFYVLMVPFVLILIGNHVFFPDIGNRYFFGLTLDLPVIFWMAYGLIALFFLTFTFGLLFKPEWLKRILILLVSIPFLWKWRTRANKIGDDLIIASKALKDKPFKFWLIAMGTTVLSWTGRFMVINCLLAAFMYTDGLTHIQIYARQLGMWVFMIVSPTPGGIGVAEYAFSGFLEVFVPFGLAGMLAILWRLISYYPYLLIGVILLPKWLSERK